MASSVVVGADVMGTVDRSVCQNGMRFSLGWGTLAGLEQQAVSTKTNTYNATNAPKKQAKKTPAEMSPCDVLGDGAEA